MNSNETTAIEDVGGILDIVGNRAFLRLDGYLPGPDDVQVTTQQVRDNDLRILAFKRPNGKLTVVLSNRSFQPHTFHIATGLEGATFKGFRYTPKDAGTNCQGVELGTLAGGTISPQLNDLTWEFWEQQ